MRLLHWERNVAEKKNGRSLALRVYFGSYIFVEKEKLCENCGCCLFYRVVAIFKHFIL